MALVVGWALVGAFVFTLVITCLSLVGWVKFTTPSQQKKLFTVIILEMVVVFGGSLVGVVRLNPVPVREALKTQGANEEIVTALSTALTDASTTGAGVTKEQARLQLDRINTTRDPQLAHVRDELRTKINALPSGPIPAPTAKQLSRSGLFMRVPPKVKQQP